MGNFPVAGHGTIVAEFFDSGRSRTLPWARRPQAAALESAWSNGKPAYRCRHGHPSAARPDPGRPKNTYIREDQILPHLATMAILLGGDGQAQGSSTVQVTIPHAWKRRIMGVLTCPRPTRPIAPYRAINYSAEIGL